MQMNRFNLKERIKQKLFGCEELGITKQIIRGHGMYQTQYIPEKVKMVMTEALVFTVFIP